ncbi:hypothetical protein CPB84DRAFT_1747171 [Gymnopilus junonius]|uniref:Uncharacterized protein n=1 Tax=Gymnopilus junonius TaxID=109634 RepID=A0A9P5NPY3_GYMJU|nr:hypothetical protein CPB84DRAFT_1747171 [Gymnopilus junonius]
MKTTATGKTHSYGKLKKLRALRGTAQRRAEPSPGPTTREHEREPSSPTRGKRVDEPITLPISRAILGFWGMGEKKKKEKKTKTKKGKKKKKEEKGALLRRKDVPLDSHKVWYSAVQIGQVTSTDMEFDQPAKEQSNYQQCTLAKFSCSERATVQGTAKPGHRDPCKGVRRDDETAANEETAAMTSPGRRRER